MSKSLCPPCVHCGRRKGNRCRNLCWVCSNDPGVRVRYPAKAGGQVSKYAGWNGRVTKPEPTRALPGTPEKELVLTGRAAAFQELWHPEDARGDED